MDHTFLLKCISLKPTLLAIAFKLPKQEIEADDVSFTTVYRFLPSGEAFPFCQVIKNITIF